MINYWDSIKNEFLAAVVSFFGAWNRFWDNRFNPKVNEEVLYLRDELARANQNLVKLIDQITAKPAEVEPEVAQEFHPVGKQHWRVRAAELERESRERKAQMQAELKSNSITAPIKTVEDLEKELLPAAEN